MCVYVHVCFKKERKKTFYLLCREKAREEE